jgi:iron complex outermembrane receptor protein
MPIIVKMRPFLAVAALFFSIASLPAETIEEIVVTADFRERPASKVAASVTVLEREEIEQLAVQHFEELLNTVPNLNWSGDGHRARYFQIRGVGELEQYQGAPNPSVGFLIDDIDFSGIGTLATLFDMQQVEVLRGPQGSRYGANALAGLIYLRSTMPTPDWRGHARITVADDDALAYGLAVGGPLGRNERVAFRASAHQHSSNGFRNNPHLGRDDTNGRDETTVRARLQWLPAGDWSVNFAAMMADIDDGYDAFALDNSYTMLSDNPGKDGQESVGASMRVEWSPDAGVSFTSITAVADSDIEFSFDADWGNTESWAPVTYDYVSISDRKRSTLSQEFRLDGLQWLVGIYLLDLQDDLETLNRGDYYDPFYDFADSLDDRFASDYEATSTALFGQYELALNEATRLSAGLRVERRTTDYEDSAGLRAGPSETMSGGELTLSHDHSDALTSYVGVSKGYKAGGFNLGLVPEDRREFGEEQLWSVEAGFKAILQKYALSLNASVFYNRRDDQQVRTSFQLDPGDPTTFVFFTDNAARGESLGFEADLLWTPGEAWSVYASIGLLEATFDEFSTPEVDLAGRRQAHAPRYTLSAGASYQHPRGFFARLDMAARDDFYFDVSHDQKSRPYELVNARIGYDYAGWRMQVWVRNLFDTEYAVRGFFFANEPPDFFPPKLYTRLGDRRQVGLTVDRSF